MEKCCETCRYDLGGGYDNCQINLEAECGAGDFEAWEPMERNDAIDAFANAFILALERTGLLSEKDIAIAMGRNGDTSSASLRSAPSPQGEGFEKYGGESARDGHKKA